MHHNVGTCGMFRCKQQCVNALKTYQKNHPFGIKKSTTNIPIPPTIPKKTKAKLIFKKFMTEYRGYSVRNQ